MTLLQTNACSPLATNAIRNNIWDNFSSETYKQLPSAGTITYYHPMTGRPMQYKLPGRRPGLYAAGVAGEPVVHGAVPVEQLRRQFNVEPGVADRLASFQDSIQQMLWPEKRDHDPIIGGKMPKGANGLPLPSAIARTTTTSYLRVPRGYLPDLLQELDGPAGQASFRSF